MQNVAAPAALKWSKWSLELVGHTRGLVTTTGDGRAAEGQGARWRLSLDVVPMKTADALAVRAWLHSLRGRSGTCLIHLLPYIGGPGGLASAGSGTLNATAAAASRTVVVSSVVHGAFQEGRLLYAGSATAGAGQLFRIVGVSSSGNIHTCTVEPAVRVAIASGQVAYGGSGMATRWRLAGDSPAIPMTNLHSLPFTLELEEAY
jgi:hypothetical protein